SARRRCAARSPPAGRAGRSSRGSSASAVSWRTPSTLDVRGAPPARPPASGMPVPPLVDAGEPGVFGGPDHDVRHTGRDLLVASGAAVRLRRGAAGDRADRPPAVRPGLYGVGAPADANLVQ